MRDSYIIPGIDVDVVRNQARDRHKRLGEVTVIHFHPYDDNNDLCKTHPQHEVYGAENA